MEHVLVAAAELIKGRFFKDKRGSRERPLTVGTVVSGEGKKTPLLSSPLHRAPSSSAYLPALPTHPSRSASPPAIMLAWKKSKVIHC